MFGAILIGTLAALGALSLLWILFGCIFGSGTGGTLFWCGQTEEMYPALHRLLVLRDLGFLRFPIAVWKQELDETDRLNLNRMGIQICALCDSGTPDGVETIDRTGDSAGNHRGGGLPEL